MRSVKVPSSFIGETAGADVLTIDRLVGVRNKWANPEVFLAVQDAYFPIVDEHVHIHTC